MKKRFLLFCVLLAGIFLPGRPAGAEEPTLCLPFCPLPAGWMIPWWSSQKFDWKPDHGTNSFLLLIRDRNPGAAFEILCDNMPQELDLSAIPAGKLSIGFEASVHTRIRLIAGDGRIRTEIECPKPEPRKEGLFWYTFPLQNAKTPIRHLSSLAIQFLEKTTSPSVKIRNFGIYSSEKNLQIPLVPSSEELKKTIAEERKLRIVTQDRHTRPEIRNGCFFQDGKYLFLLGPNAPVPLKSLERDDSYMKNQHIAYRKYVDREVLDSLGLNSTHFNLPNPLYTPALGYGITRNFKREIETAHAFLRTLGGTPLNVDFAFVNSEGFRHAFPEQGKRMVQKNSNWCYFIPFCPDSEEGRTFYRNCFRLGTSSLLKTGANPFLYELFNESRYNCQCDTNRKKFAQAMKAKYGTIQAANARWKTMFASFDAAASVKDFNSSFRMIPDWHEFASTRYAEILKEGKDAIRSIDKRPNVYITEQCSQGVFLNSFAAIGMDYRKIAAVVDSLGSEGGWRSYGYGSIKYGGIMEDAATSGNSYSYIADIYQALSKGKKPILNHEHYCARFHDGKRVPSSKTDLITSMWNEIMRGVSGSYLYTLHGWLTEWKNLEEARKQVEKPSWKSYMMLNPYAYPLETLDAFRQFMRELEPYREQVLPFPRFGKPAVAIFFSYPTLIMSGASKENVRRKMLEWYNAVLFRQYPLQIVFEEELASLDPAVRALIVPAATYAKEETLRDVEKFLGRGGIVIADQQAFCLDEYGDPQKKPIRGRIYRLNAADERSVEELRKILLKHEVPRHGTVTALSGPALQQTELHLIDRGDFKLCFLVNMEYLESRDVRISLNIRDTGRFYLTDPVNRRTLVQKNSETWSADDLRKGFVYTIPAQERVLFVLEHKRPENTVFLSPEEQKSLSESIHRKERETVRAFRKKHEQKRKREKAKFEKYADVALENCIPLDLRSVANRDLADPVAKDGKGGWMDDGPDYDLSTIPTGTVSAAGIPFQIPKTGKAAVVLLSRHSPYGKERVSGIEVGRCVRALYFLHACGWDSPENTPVMTYIIHYADGTKAEFPVRFGREIANWWNLPSPSHAKLGLTATAKSGQEINLQCCRWENPDPKKMVTSLEVVSANGESIPGIVGITAETVPVRPSVLKQIPEKAKVVELKRDSRFRTANGNLFLVSYPSFLNGGWLVSIPRGRMSAPAPSWEITLNGPAEIYLLVHNYGSPEIPKDWERLPELLSWGVRKGLGWQKDRIYKKSVSGGRVVIPGHNGHGHGNYGIPNAVVIQKK